jgi:glycosyltransferase involved in cell wall biosynthesis
MNLPRLALLADYPEEQWHSMDLCADMLDRHLRAEQGDRFHVSRYCPPYKTRLGRLPVIGKRSIGINADRLLNRLWHYPRSLRRDRGAFDLFHICDHSYSHLVHDLPAERTGVFCHDLDTFRCLLRPEVERRPRWFRAMARRILEGMQKAAVVFHTTNAVREEILAHGLIEAERLIQAPLGVAPEFQPESSEPDAAAQQLSAFAGHEFLLHVGSCIPRKRIDLLLHAFAAIRAEYPDLRLVKAGGTWTNCQREQMNRLGICQAVHHFQNANREQLASLYRRAKLVLITSDSEGFGLPAIEALACGAAVVASDIAPLREAGGEAMNYVPAGDVPAWLETLRSILGGQLVLPAKEMRLAQAEKFSWRHHASIIAEAYARLDRTADAKCATVKES